MLTEICAEIRNYFLANKEKDIHADFYTIENGTIALDFLKEGQYFRICGSALNDGVHQYPAENLSDESFTGTIWAMSVPPAMISLDEEITGWVENNADSLSSPFTAESFKGYSYSKSSGKNGTAGYTWQDQFATRLNAWRRLNVL